MREKILILNDWFAPGYKAGGPIQSCVNFAYLMRDTYDIYVFTSDRDLNEKHPYPGIKTNEWIAYDDHIFLYYCSPENQKTATLRHAIAALAPGYLYLNSMFTTYFTVLPLVLNRLKPLPLKIILAPRGMLRSSALQFKGFKKQVFLRLSKWFGLMRDITFHATEPDERRDIMTYFPKNRAVEVVNNAPSTRIPPFRTADKKANELKILYVGRIHPIKNLLFLLKVLAEVSPTLSSSLTIIGQVEDIAYWGECQAVSADLPAHISVQHLGSMPNSAIGTQIQDHHFSAQPTFGENFGHSIFESFLNGRPVLVSDQTPWRGLEASKIGWDIPLSDVKAWKEKIEYAASLPQAEFDEWCRAAQQFAQDYIRHSDLKIKYEHLFSNPQPVPDLTTRAGLEYE